MLFDNYRNKQETSNSYSQPAVRASSWLSSRAMRGKKERFSEVVWITPDMAEEILARCNTNNRAITPSVVKKYSISMQRGEWRLTPESISISKTGILNDGQHRLMAVVMSGVKVRFTIWFGTDREEFKVVDQGKSRTGGDLVSIIGYKNPNVVASVGALLYRIERQISAFVPPYVIEEYVISLDKGTIDRACLMGMRAKKRTTPSASALAFYVIDRESPAKAKLEEFWESFVSGEMLPRGSSILSLYEVLESPKHLGSSSSSREMNVRRAAAIIKAWNRWTGRVRSRDLSWTETMTLPEVM